MEYLVSKIDAAVDQLDFAIRLFLDSRAYPIHYFGQRGRRSNWSTIRRRGDI